MDDLDTFFLKGKERYKMQTPLDAMPNIVEGGRIYGDRVVTQADCAADASTQRLSFRLYFKSLLGAGCRNRTNDLLITNKLACHFLSRRIARGPAITLAIISVSRIPTDTRRQRASQSVR